MSGSSIKFKLWIDLKALYMRQCNYGVCVLYINFAHEIVFLYNFSQCWGSFQLNACTRDVDLISGNRRWSVVLLGSWMVKSFERKSFEFGSTGCWDISRCTNDLEFVEIVYSDDDFLGDRRICLDRDDMAIFYVGFWLTVWLFHHYFLLFPSVWDL